MRNTFQTNMCWMPNQRINAAAAAARFVVVFMDHDSGALIIIELKTGFIWRTVVCCVECYHLPEKKCQLVTFDFFLHFAIFVT